MSPFSSDDFKLAHNTLMSDVQSQGGYNADMGSLTLRRILATLAWLAIGLSAVALMAAAHAAYICGEAKGGPPIPKQYESLKLAASLLGMFSAGAAFGAAIETVTLKQYYFPVVGVFVSRALMVLWVWLTR